MIENNKIESDAVFLKSIELKRNCELKSVCEDSSSIHSVETPSGSPKCHKYFNSLQPQITQSLKNIKLGVLNENDEEIIDLLSSQLQSTKNKRESSNHHSLELIRSLKNKHSEEEKEAMQLTSAIKADFKSKFYKFSNELKIPVIKRNSILKFLEKEKESQRKLSKKHDLKLASDIMIRKKATFLIITKMNFDFKKKNPLYWSSIKFQKKSIMHMNEFDRIHTRKNSIYRKNFDENKKKFSEKLGGFFKYHQNPFYDNHHINLKASKLINGKFAFFFEKTSINLSQILSNKAVKASFNEDENDSSMSNSYEDDEKVYKFKSRSDKDKYMIKISPPEIDNEMDLYHSLTHNFSPKKLTKSEKSPRSLTNQKFFDTEQQQIKKFLSNIKTLFIDLEQKCAKTLQIYNYKKHWKMFKTAFFTNLQIFITANLIEIMTIDFRDIQTTEKLSNYQKIEDLINERNINFTTSFNYLCPLNSHLIKSQEIWNTKYSEGFEIIAFDYKFEMNEKKEDKEELRKIIKCSEIEEDGDSPLLIWDLNSKLSLNMEEDFHVILDKREESQILFFDKEDDNEEFEQEKNYRRLKNGAKLEIISISFKNLENLFNYMNSLIIPFVSSLDFQSKEPFLIHFSLGHQLDMSTFVLDNSILKKQTIKIFINFKYIRNTNKKMESEKKIH